MTEAAPPAIAVSEIDQRLARTALELLEPWLMQEGLCEFSSTDENGQTHSVELPARVTGLLLEALRQTAAGKAVSLIEAESEVTTQQAAAILRVSRPIVVSLVEDGRLAARRVGNRLRLPIQDVLEFKAANGPKRRAPLIAESSSGNQQKRDQDGS